ncbi:hypothetical protein STXM2123_645 [Streptomyces sp. F-3]|nr:hypothetical protein STXM2123_645 [Streptomyces sp. F-3]
MIVRVRGVFFEKKITPRQRSSATDSAARLTQLRPRTATIAEKPPSPVESAASSATKVIHAP